MRHAPSFARSADGAEKRKKTQSRGGWFLRRTVSVRSASYIKRDIEKESSRFSSLDRDDTYTRIYSVFFLLHSFLAFFSIYFFWSSSMCNAEKGGRRRHVWRASVRLVRWRFTRYPPRDIRVGVWFVCRGVFCTRCLIIPRAAMRVLVPLRFFRGCFAGVGI